MAKNERLAIGVVRTKADVARFDALLNAEDTLAATHAILVGRAHCALRARSWWCNCGACWCPRSHANRIWSPRRWVPPCGPCRLYGRSASATGPCWPRPSATKRLWLKCLQPDAREILCAAVVPAIQREGAASSAHGVLPFSPATMDALVVALRQVPDPRGASTIFRSGSVLCIVAMALLSGNRDIAEIHRFGQCLKPAQRQALGLPRGKGKGFWRVPGYNVYYNLLCRLDLDRFATVLTAWLQSQAGTLPACLALLRSALLAIYARLRDMYGCLPAIIENLRANPLTVQRLVMGKL